MTNNIVYALKDALSRSTCWKHPVAVVLEIKNGVYVGGWNGGPTRGQYHNECSRKGLPSGVGMELCPSVHAERRAISIAANEGISSKGATIYMNEWFPCADCAKSIIEAGITRLVTPDEIYKDISTYTLIDKLLKQSYNFEMAEKLLREADIELIVDASIRPI